MKRVIFWNLLMLMVLALPMIVACGDDEPNDSNGGNNGSGTTEQVFTGMATDVTATSATISCNFTSASAASSLQLGVLFSTERSVVDNKQGVLSLANSVSGNTYTVGLSNLSSNIIYYYRAVMISGGNTYYGSVNSFTTSQGQLVDTGDATDLTYKSATITSSFRNNYINSYEQLGVQFSASREALESGNGQKVTTSDVTGTSTFSVSLTNLTELTTYYYRAYVKTYSTTYLGEIKSFTTLKNTIDYNGHEFVDLGLPSGIKWATTNIGASTPEDFGDYYAWGETMPKTSYTQDNYQWNGLTIDELVARGVIREVPMSSTTDYVLTASYDVATVKWGSVWRMPTWYEIKELERNTKATVSTQNGVEGYLLTSTNNRKSIFLPATGWWSGSTHNTGWSSGDYWSSTPNDYHDEYSIYISLSTIGLEHGISNTGGMRYYGMAIRPVSSY